MLLLAACGKEEPIQTSASALRISPAVLSAETEHILGALGSEAVFFDYAGDGEAEGLSVKVWFCTDGAWQLVGESNENLELYPQGRIAFEMRDDGFLLANITDSGHVTSTHPQTVDFADLDIVGTAVQTMTLTPESGEEVVLWLKTGTNERAAVRSLHGDFRENRCEAGIALTAVFY